MKSLSLICALSIFAPLTCHAVESLAPGWQVVDIGNGIKPSFDFDADDAIHVMGMSESFDGIVWHAKATTIDGPWTPATVGSGYYYGPGDIRVDRSTGDAHIAWHDHDAASPQHAIVRPDDTIVSFVLDSDGHDGWDNSLAISPSGIVHMASVNPSGFGASDSLQYATFDGTAWAFQDVVANSGAFMYGLNTSIALDSSDTPHVLFCDSEDWVADGSLVHATAGSPNWSFETITTGGPVGRFPTLAIGPDDRLHATWLDVDPADNSKGTIQYGTRADGDANWTIVPVATLGAVQLGFSDARKSASIALDSVGIPHIAYADTATINYAALKDGNWQSTTVLDNDDATYKSLAVLRLDSQDRPGIVLSRSDPSGDTVRLARPMIVTNRPPASTPVDPITANESAHPIAFDTSPFFSDPDKGDVLRFSIASNSNPAIFSRAAIDPDSGLLSLEFAPWVDGVSEIVVEVADQVGLTARATVSVTLPALPALIINVSDPPRLNLQTGLFEQSVTVRNPAGRAAAGFDLTISGLPDDVCVNNASDCSGDTATIENRQVLAAGASVTLVIEYFVPSRSSTIAPQFVASLVSTPETDPQTTASGFAIDRCLSQGDGSLLLEFPSKPGSIYEIHYSDDLEIWKLSPVKIRAAGNRVQWIDRGPPRTDTAPADGPCRFYRVREFLGKNR